MRAKQNHGPGTEGPFVIDTKDLTAHELPSTSGPQVTVVGHQAEAAASPGAAARSASSGVIVGSESDPMTDPAGKEQHWFEPFEIRRRKGFLEITVRIIQGTLALFFSLAALNGIVMTCIRLVTGGQQGFPNLVFLLLAESAFLPLATLMVFVTARRFVYWKVNQAGIEQYWFGFRIWRLPWNEIVSRRLGPVATPSWLFLFIIPIAGGLYQPIVLEDRQGRIRKVNRLGTNGDRLDEFLRWHLNPAGETRLAQVHSDAIRRAQATHAHQGPAQVPLHLCTRASPVVRMKMHEPRLLPVCCNCLGPVEVRAPIAVSGLNGFLEHGGPGFFPLMIPLCAVCHNRAGRGRWTSSFFGGVALIFVGALFLSAGGVARGRWELAVYVLLGVASVFGASVILWRGIRNLSLDKLVKVVDASSGEDWMDVQFGNPDYAHLVDELNGMNPETRPHPKGAPDPNAAGNDWIPEL
jgi:hypothetical protein